MNILKKVVTRNKMLTYKTLYEIQKEATFWNFQCAFNFSHLTLEISLINRRYISISHTKNPSPLPITYYTVALAIFVIGMSFRLDTFQFKVL